MEKDRPFIQIYKESFSEEYGLECWLVFERRLEKRLEKEHYNFEFDAEKNSLNVYVKDKNEALHLGLSLRVRRIIFFNGGNAEIIPCNQKSEKRQRVFVQNEKGVKLSLRQFKKEAVDKNNLILKSEVVKRGIFTKSELEKILRAGGLKIEEFGGKHYFDRNKIKEYLFRKQ